MKPSAIRFNNAVSITAHFWKQVSSLSLAWCFIHIPAQMGSWSKQRIRGSGEMFVFWSCFQVKYLEILLLTFKIHRKGLGQVGKKLLVILRSGLHLKSTDRQQNEKVKAVARANLQPQLRLGFFLMLRLSLFPCNNVRAEREPCHFGLLISSADQNTTNPPLKKTRCWNFNQCLRSLPTAALYVRTCCRNLPAL